MKRLLARLEFVEATGMLEIDMAWVNGNYQRILFHSVRTASADRVREMAAPRRHLALVCFLHQAWRDTLDLFEVTGGLRPDRGWDLRTRGSRAPARRSTASRSSRAASAPVT